MGWVAVVVYLFHNFEEYGIAADGAHHAFPDSLCTTLNQSAYPQCPIPTEFYLFVNIGLIWVVAVICALLARKYVMMGSAFYSIVIVNCFFHIVPAVVTGTYNPGLLAAVVMFLPASTCCSSSTQASSCWSAPSSKGRCPQSAATAKTGTQAAR
ncbi:HXXEE domain-containing protein [Nonomuraea sp. NPDC051191]|uniref:HXXEE domain-containing protein n=1 Tax=Nonomuraea sp. NPDC051191 TaxID=3364372 RepID=UPI00378B15A7